MRSFQARMAEFTRLSSAISKSELALKRKAEEIAQLQDNEENCSQAIEKQQKSQWELEDVYKRQY